MNWQALETRLMSVARARKPDDSVPPGFAGRMMARLLARPEDPWALWAAALWRPAMACLTVAVVISLWSYVQAKSDATNLSEVYDATVYTVAEQLTDNW